MRHNIIYFDYQVENNIESVKFIFKVENNNNKGNKLIEIRLYEENILRFVTRFYKHQIKTVMLLLSKSELMSTNIRVLFLIKVFTEQLSIIHKLSK